MRAAVGLARRKPGLARQTKGCGSRSRDGQSREEGGCLLWAWSVSDRTCHANCSNWSSQLYGQSFIRSDGTLRFYTAASSAQPRSHTSPFSALSSRPPHSRAAAAATAAAPLTLQAPAQGPPHLASTSPESPARSSPNSSSSLRSVASHPPPAGCAALRWSRVDGRFGLWLDPAGAAARGEERLREAGSAALAAFSRLSRCSAFTLRLLTLRSSRIWCRRAAPGLRSSRRALCAAAAASHS
jgi:hypothetical protein